MNPLSISLDDSTLFESFSTWLIQVKKEEKIALQWICPEIFGSSRLSQFTIHNFLQNNQTMKSFFFRKEIKQIENQSTLGFLSSLSQTGLLPDPQTSIVYQDQKIILHQDENEWKGNYYFINCLIESADQKMKRLFCKGHVIFIQTPQSFLQQEKEDLKKNDPKTSSHILLSAELFHFCDLGPSFSQSKMYPSNVRLAPAPGLNMVNIQRTAFWEPIYQLWKDESCPLTIQPALAPINIFINYRLKNLYFYMVSEMTETYQKIPIQIFSCPYSKIDRINDPFIPFYELSETTIIKLRKLFLD